MQRVITTPKMFDEDEKYIEDFEWALGLNRLGLRLMGVWPDDEVIHDRRLIVLLRVPFMIFAMFFFLFVPQMYALTLVIHELPLVIDNLMTSCPAIMCCFKLYFIWRSKQVLRPVIQSFTRDWLRQGKRAWEYAAMRREAMRARLFTVSGYVVVALCYGTFTLSPFFGINVRLITNITDHGERHLFSQSYYPYDYTKSPCYELTHMSQMLAGFFVTTSVSIPDNYFGALVFHASAQFEILGMDLEQFIREDDTRLKRARNKDFNTKMGAFVDRHVHLITLVKAVENSFSFVIVAQIICTAIMICCLGFEILNMFKSNAGDKPSLFQLFALVSSIITMLIHTLVDCFASETLSLRSAGISYNIYSSKWYAVPGRSMQNMIPMMVISKSSRQLTAGKMLFLSLETYSSILKSIAGYLSMLISVNKG